MLFCSLCGVAGGIMMIVAGFMDEAAPFWLRAVAAVCLLLNAVGAFLNVANIKKES